MQAPFVLLEVPGYHYAYGPHDHWKETYIRYIATKKEFFSRWGLKSKEELLWPVHNLPATTMYLELLLKLSSKLTIPGIADKIDRHAEMAIIESRIAEHEKRLTDAEKRIRDAEQYIRDHYQKPFNLEKLASDYGFSLAGFFRHWNECFFSTPAKFITGLRLGKASRMLTQTRVDVKEIANYVGIDNSRHFATLFRQRFGISPTEYRKRYTP
ncbi:MAG: helix-turn-helix domain-containing protein [Chitinivibrionales bacterium]|nr:helix-turn-helix domain-containing protein [Chitinivibrionales bacterium]